MTKEQKIIERQEFGSEDGALALGKLLDGMHKDSFTREQRYAVADAADALLKASKACEVA